VRTLEARERPLLPRHAAPSPAGRQHWAARCTARRARCRPARCGAGVSPRRRRGAGRCDTDQDGTARDRRPRPRRSPSPEARACSATCRARLLPLARPTPHRAGKASARLRRRGGAQVGVQPGWTGWALLHSAAAPGTSVRAARAEAGGRVVPGVGAARRGAAQGRVGRGTPGYPPLEYPGILQGG
jgi:hypothetical protein